MPQRIPRYIGNHLAGAYIVMVCAAAVSFAILLYLYNDQAQQTQRLAKQSLALAQAIQDQRRDVIRGNCEAQNKRHKDLEAFLYDQGITQEARPDVYVFIDKLAPLQDCDLVVKEATTTDP